MRGPKPDSSFALTVLTFEYLPRRAGIFGTPTGHGDAGGLVPGSGVGAEVTSIGLPAARCAFGDEPALWAGPAIAGKKLQAIEANDVQPDGRNVGKSDRALELTYGGGGCCGRPQPSAVSIRQARDDEVGRGNIGSDEVPPAGSAALTSGSTYVDDREFPHWTAVLRHGRLLVAIDGPTRELVLDAARSLRPIPAEAR